MSDALSDIAKDEMRYGYFGQYLKKVKSYILSPNSDSLREAIEAASMVDSVGSGFWGSSTNLSENVEEHLKGLFSEDSELKEKEWAKLLSMVFNRHHIFKELKALSPFANNFIVLVDYGVGFVTFDGAKEWLDDLVFKAIRNQDMKTYDCDKYLAIMPPINIKPEDVKAIWLRCGRSDVKGPRKP